VSTQIFIQGEDRVRDIEPYSIALRREAGFRPSDMAFSLKPREGYSLPTAGDIVEFYEDGELLFSGKVAQDTNHSPLPLKTGDVSITDWNEALMGELVRSSYEETILVEVVQAVIAERVLEESLVMMLQFEEGTGTEARDSTINRNHADLVGGVTWDTTDYGVIFDGEPTTYLTVEHEQNLEFSGNFSVCIEFSADILGETLLAKSNTGFGPYAVIVDSSGEVVFRVATDSSTSFSVSTNTQPIETGETYTVVCTYDKSSGMGRIYIDGVLAASGSLTTSDLVESTSALLIGVSSTGSVSGFFDIMGLQGLLVSGSGGSAGNFEGTIFRISLYSRLLSAIEARRWHVDILEVKAPRRLIAQADTSIASVVFPYEYPADCFTKLARLLGLVWRIDERMFVSFIEQTGGTSVITIDEDDGISTLKGTVQVQTDISQVRNRVYVRGGVYPTSWRNDPFSADGVRKTFPLPYAYKGFELFTDDISLCASIQSLYKMEEASGDLADETGANTLTATNLTYAATGILDDCIEFNGTTSKARKTSATHPTEAHTLLAWINPDVHDTTQRVILGFGNFAQGHSKLSLIVVSGTYYLRQDFGDGITEDIEVGDLSGGWHLVGMSFDPDTTGGPTIRVYLDGVEVADAVLSGTPDIDTGVVEIGGNNGSNVFDGKIDECTIFSYALSAQEHLGLYLLNDAEGISAPLVRSGVEFLNTSGFDGYYNYTEKNYRFDSAPSDGTLFYATGQPEIPVQAVRANTQSITLYGERELSIEDSTVVSLIEARQLAAAELARRKDAEQVVTFKTYVTGINPGATLRLTLPSFGIASRDFFVQKVELSTQFLVETNGKKYLYTVECVNVVSKDWIDFLRDAFVRNKNRIDPGEGEAIEDIVSHTEDLGVADAYNIATPTDHTEVIEVADVHTPLEVVSGGFKWSNDAGTTPDKARWGLSDWG